MLIKSIMKKSSIIKYLFLAVIFIAGITIALLVSDKIALPFHNPWGVVGLLTVEQYNPANDILKFLVIITLPSLILAAGFIPFNRYLRFGNIIRGNGVSGGFSFKNAFPGKKLLVILSIIFVIIIPLNIQTYHSCGETVDTFHEGESMGTAISYLAGDIPYKETIFVHGLFADPLRSVLAFRLFGRSIGAVRTLQSIIKLISFILLFLVLLKLFRNNYLYATGTFFILTVAIFLKFLLILPRDITTFLFIYLFLSLYETLEIKSNFSRIRFIILTFLFSFVPFASFAYSIDRGFYLSAAYLLFTPMLIVLYHRKGLTKQFISSSVFGIVSAILLTGYLLKWDFADFFNFTFLIMPKYKELMDGMVYPFYDPKFLFPVSLIALNLFWIVYTFLNALIKGDRIIVSVREYIEHHLIEIFLFVISVFFFRSALGRSAWEHIAYSSTAIYILSVYIVIKYYLHPFFTDKGKFIKPIFIFTTITLSAIIITGSYRIHKNRLIATNFPCHTDDSEFIPDNYKKTIVFLNNNLDDDESFFTMTSEAMWYYFINKPSPTAFPVIWFAMPDFYQKMVVDELKSGNVKIILYKNDFWTNAIDDFTNQERLPLIDSYIRTNYSFLKKIDDNELWIKN